MSQQLHKFFSRSESGSRIQAIHPHSAINAQAAEDFSSEQPSDNALGTEIILSLLGIFGVGWLLAGETIIGGLLLAGSIFIYWPLVIMSTLFTSGISLICLGPFAIACVIGNGLLLSFRLKRKVVREG